MATPYDQLTALAVQYRQDAEQARKDGHMRRYNALLRIARATERAAATAAMNGPSL